MACPVSGQVEPIVVRPLLVAQGHPRSSASDPLAETWRRSKLFPGARLAHGDLHNHTLLSDGAGDPEVAFETMRGAGLDVAAITDHALYPGAVPLDEEHRLTHGYLRSLSGAGWQQLARLASRARRDGAFVAIRGFEWTSPRLGHMNVWFSTRWTDGLSTHAYHRGDDQVAMLPRDAFQRAGGVEPLDWDGPPMHPFHAWLRRSPDANGGEDGLVGFNHPGREPERFGNFAPAPDLCERVVSMEIFNRSDDYLLRGVASGARSPLVECLDARWQVGLIGVSDEHSANWGCTAGYGRTGIWVRELTPAGVREALLARRVFATRRPGFRLDAAANGVRMGGRLTHTGGPIHVVLDVDGGKPWWGRKLTVQLLGHGAVVPRVLWAGTAIVQRDDQPPFHFDVDLPGDATPWLVIRVGDPEATEPYEASLDLELPGAAVAYSSPFFLTSSC
jgi:hypothetical protein